MRALCMLFAATALGAANDSMRGRLWIQWQGPAYHHWAGEVRLGAGRILRARCRKMHGTPGILQGRDARRAWWQTQQGYDAGTCESIVLDVDAPADTRVALRTPAGEIAAKLEQLRRRKLEVFTGRGQSASYLSVEFRILYARRTVERITRLKPIHTRTPLVGGGKAMAAIVAGDLPSHQAQARRIQQAVAARTGVALPILAPDAIVGLDYRMLPKAVGVDRPHYILLGDINSNPALVPLYAQSYVIVDAQFPGDGGYSLRTVCDPWGMGQQALVAGAGDDAGLAAAVGALIGRPEFKQGRGDLVLPLVAEFKPGKRGSAVRPGLMSSVYWAETFPGRRGIRLRPGSPIEHNNLHNFLIPLGLLGRAYAWTGNEAIPQHVKAKLDESGLVEFLRDDWGAFVAWREANPDKFHLFMKNVLPGWDVLEESPAFTDADRLAVTNVLWNIMNGMCTRRDKPWLTRGQTELQQGILMFHSPNHETWSGLALDQLGRYFKKYYPDLEESDYWLELAHAEFAGHETTFEMIEDAKGFQARDTRACMTYAMASRELGYFRRGVAAAAADFECVVTDNLGYGAGYGDTGLTVSGVPSDILTQAEWYYRTGEYQWLAQNLIKGPTKRPLWACKAAAKRPDRLLGIHVVSAYEWAHEKSVHYRSEEWIDFPKRPRKGYNKISFREAFRPDAQYLLMDGRRKLAYHNHDDSNTIVRFTDNGRMWIVDCHPSLRAVQDQNALTYDVDGRGASLGSDADATLVADLGQLGFVRSHVEPYGSASWTRSVVWSKGDWFVVFDQLHATKPGDYLVRCHWRLRGKPTYDAHGVTLDQAGERFRLQCATRATIRHEDLDMTNIWGKAEANYGYSRFAKPICRIVHEEQRRVLAKPATIGFANVFYAFNGREPMDLKLTQAGETAALLEGSRRGERVAALVGLGGYETAALSTDAQMFFLGAKRWALAGVTRVSLSGKPVLSASAPVSFEARAGGEAGVLVAAQSTELRVFASQTKIDGRAVPTGGKAFTLAPGRHSLTGLGPSQQVVERVLAAARARAAEDQGPRRQAAMPTLPARRLWQADLGQRVTCASMGDANGDGRDELLIGMTDGQAAALSLADGKPVWTFDAGAPVRAIVAADLDDDGRRELIVCARDAHCVGADGRERWRFEPLSLGERRTYGAAVARLKGLAGKSVLIAGARLNVLSPDGKLRWYQPPDGLALPKKWMPNEFVAAADLDGDGFDEAVAAVQMSYPFVYAMDGQRKLVMDFPGRKPSDWRRHRWPLSGRVKFMRCADVDGDGETEIVAAGTSGGVRACERVGDAWREYPFPMAGEPMAMDVIEGRNSQPGLIAAADASHFVYLFKGQPTKDRVLWRKRLDQATTALALTGAGDRLFLGTSDGRVAVLDAKGVLLGLLPTNMGSEIVRLHVVRGGQTLLIVAAAGRVQARGLP